jgi:hypothetical protein
MQGNIVEVLQDINPNNRDELWYNKYITILRMQWRPLFAHDRIRKNKQIILSEQSMQKIIDSFKDKHFKENTNFTPLGIWNRMVNIIVEELIKSPPKCELNATDAQALIDKKSDILLLKQKKILENDLNSNAKKVGDPATFIVGNDKFKGNIEEFARLQLDPNDPDDIGFYENSDFPKLKYEIAGQNLINTVMKVNRFDEDTIRKFVLDILAVLGICMQSYVDEITGEIKYRYIFPEEAWGIFGDTEDGSNDICKGIQRSTTIREWLGAVGNTFDWNRDWKKLLSGINYLYGMKYTGFIRDGVNYDCFGNTSACNEGGCLGLETSSLVNWSQAYLFKVYTGYVEWNLAEATSTYLKKVDTGELIPGQIDIDYDVTKSTGYSKESFYQEQMYKSNFLVTGAFTQFNYNYGQLYFTRLEGSFDEIAKGTLMYYRYEGKSAAEISEPYVDTANLAFYRMKWLLSKVKPPDEEYVFDELIQMSQGFKKGFTQNSTSNNLQVAPQTILEQVIQYQRENTVKLRFFPQVEGKTIPQIPSLPVKRSEEEFLAIQMQNTVMWCENQIAEKIGLNDIRLGQQENDRQGFKQGQAETQASLNSTGYVYRMVQFLKQHIATITCNYAQDIIRYKDTLPYNYLKKLLGEDDFENLKLLGDFAQHRYGIIVNDYNAGMERNLLIQAAFKSLDSGDGRGGISVEQFGILLLTDDYKKLFKLWGYYKYKAAKILRAQQLQDTQTQQQNAMQLEQAKQQTQKIIGQLAITKEQVAADGYKYAADKTYAAKIDTKQLGISGETQKITEKTDAEKQIAENKATIELEKALHP